MCTTSNTNYCMLAKYTYSVRVHVCTNPTQLHCASFPFHFHMGLEGIHLIPGIQNSWEALSPNYDFLWVPNHSLMLIDQGLLWGCTTPQGLGTYGGDDLFLWEQRFWWLTTRQSRIFGALDASFAQFSICSMQCCVGACTSVCMGVSAK